MLKNILFCGCCCFLLMLIGVFGFVFPGYSFSALVCAGILALMLVYKFLDYLARRKPELSKTLKRILTVCLCVGLLLAAVTEGFILHASLGNPQESCQYVVVLGAKVRHDGPSVSLGDRIYAAYDYLCAHPDVICIASGGQGADEPMSEAQCIYNHLVEMGIDPSRIWLEEHSTSTWENLNFTLDLIEEKTGVRPDKLGIISSEYHMFRAGLMAQKCGITSVGIPAATSIISQRVNHFMREIAGVWHYIFLGG